MNGMKASRDQEVDKPNEKPRDWCISPPLCVGSLLGN